MTIPPPPLFPDFSTTHGAAFRPSLLCLYPHCIQQLIQTYEKSKAADENNLASSQEWHLSSPTAAGGGEKSTKVFTKRKSRYVYTT